MIMSMKHKIQDARYSILGTIATETNKVQQRGKKCIKVQRSRYCKDAIKSVLDIER